MTQFVFVVLTDPVEGEEDEFNRWYDDVHLADVLSVDGTVSARRFRYADIEGEAPPAAYLAIYEWEADSLESARAALSRARQQGRLAVPGSLDRTKTRAWFFEAVGERRAASPPGS